MAQSCSPDSERVAHSEKCTKCEVAEFIIHSLRSKLQVRADEAELLASEVGKLMEERNSELKRDEDTSHLKLVHTQEQHKLEIQSLKILHKQKLKELNRRLQRTKKRARKYKERYIEQELLASRSTNDIMSPATSPISLMERDRDAPIEMPAPKKSRVEVDLS